MNVQVRTGDGLLVPYRCSASHGSPWCGGCVTMPRSQSEHHVGQDYAGDRTEGLRGDVPRKLPHR